MISKQPRHAELVPKAFGTVSVRSMLPTIFYVVPERSVRITFHSIERAIFGERLFCFFTIYDVFFHLLHRITA